MKWCAVRSPAQDRKFEFDLERATFAMALQRLCAPGSDLAGSEWVKTVEAPGFEGLALQHFYRTAAFLAGVRQDLESRLFHRDLNLFNQTLEADLQQRLDDRKVKVSWPDLMQDLGQVQSVAVELDGRRYQLRTDLVGAAHQAFAAAIVLPVVLSLRRLTSRPWQQCCWWYFVPRGRND